MPARPRSVRSPDVAVRRPRIPDAWRCDRPRMRRWACGTIDKGGHHGRLGNLRPGCHPNGCRESLADGDHTCGYPAGELSRHPHARSRWHGDRLCGRAPADRARSGHQDPPRGVLGRSQGAPALHEGGEVGGGARPPERDRRPRGGPAGGPLLHGDGACRGGEHGRRPRSTGRVGLDRSHPHRRGRMPGAVGRARCGARPPRHQAGQHPPDRRPHGQAGRLRAGSMHRPGAARA